MKNIIFIGLIFCLILVNGCGEKCSGMDYSDAIKIASSSDCVLDGGLTEERSCNEISHTWWIELDIEKENCNPACVVNAETGKAEINWRCTGVKKLTGGVVRITGSASDSFDFTQE